MGSFGARLTEVRQPVRYANYIANTGTQYIDTEFKPSSQNVMVVCDFEYTTSPKTKSLFGAESSNSFPITFYSRNANTAETFVGKTYDATSHTVATNTRYLLTCHANNGSFTSTLNGEQKSGTYTGNLLQTLPLYLFTNNGNTSKQCISAKVYSFQIYDNGVLVRDLRPCYDPDGVACMYDKVGQKYYYNAGTGEFIAG